MPSCKVRVLFLTYPHEKTTFQWSKVVSEAICPTNKRYVSNGSGTSSAWNENLRPLLNRNISPISGKYGLRNHFWPLESGFLMRKSEKKSPNFLGPLLPILKLTFLEWSRNFRKFGFKKMMGIFFYLTSLQDPCVTEDVFWGGRFLYCIPYKE